MKNWLLPHLKQYKGQMTLVLLFGLLGILSGAMLLFTSGFLISKSALRPENIMIVYVPIVAVRAFSIGQAAFPYVEKLISHDLVLRILSKMRIALYRIVEPQAIFFRSRYQTGDLLGMLADDIEHLQNLYLKTIIPGVLGLLLYSVFIGVFGLFDVPFALLMGFMLGVLVFLVPLLSYYKTRNLHLAVSTKHHTLYQQLTDAIFGLSDWQASGRTNEFLENHVKQVEQLFITEQKIKNWHRLRDACLQLMIGLIIIVMLIWSSNKAADATIAPTLIAAFTLMIFSVADALFPLSDAMEKIPSYSSSIARINDVRHHEAMQNEIQAGIKEQQASIMLEHVRYTYPDADKQVLDDIYLSIPAGRKVAILGKSGTGKSTLLKILAGMLKPTGGSIRLNGKTIDSEALAAYVSVFNQKPHLFDTTLENNIRIGRPDATVEEILEVIKQAQLENLVASLPKGIATPVHEFGSRFSGGERQRIAFARVLLQDKPIILVDEATIGLDPKTELDLIETMLEAAEGKTIIWVTHHLAGMEMMDEIIFMQNGRIFMQGGHEELIDQFPYYRKLYRMDRGIYHTAGHPVQ